MNNKALGWAILIPMYILALGGALGYTFDSSATSILGLVMLVFGTWAGIRLIKSEKTEKVGV